MCAEIRDASNLAWKLADVVRSELLSTLLDTYESERSPHELEFIRTGLRLGSVIQTTDPEAARQRSAAFARQPVAFSTPLGPGCHEGGQASGRLWPQGTGIDGSRTDDEAGDGWLLYVAPGLDGASAHLASAGVEVMEARHAEHIR
jgi:3-(3-hydroxy-phenyl)propionate hydroxylase